MYSINSLLARCQQCGLLCMICADFAARADGAFYWRNVTNAGKYSHIVPRGF